MSKQHLLLKLVSSRVALLAAIVCLGISPAQAQLGVATVDDGKIVDSIVLEWDWNSDGDFEGWTPNAGITSPTVAGGELSGTSNDGDPFINSPAMSYILGSGPGQVSRAQFAATFDVDSPIVRTDLFFFTTTPGVFGAQGWSLGDFPVIGDGQEHIYTLDLNLGALAGLEISSMRLDPVSDTPGTAESFSYNYLRVGLAPVPEPASAAMLLLGALSMGVCRRRAC